MQQINGIFNKLIISFWFFKHKYSVPKIKCNKVIGCSSGLPANSHKNSLLERIPLQLESQLQVFQPKLSLVLMHTSLNALPKGNTNSEGILRDIPIYDMYGWRFVFHWHLVIILPLAQAKKSSDVSDSSEVVVHWYPVLWSVWWKRCPCKSPLIDA